MAAQATETGLGEIKTRQQAMWASGDFAVIGTTLQLVGELLCEGVDLRAGERVLDVAAGNGNATLAAARRFGKVTSTDYVPALLERGRRRAEAEGLTVTFEVADAEALPYPDASFDVVLSSFGVMFAPDHRQSARELMRVCRPGGRIGLASWTPPGFLGHMFKVIATHVPPIPGVQSPLLWGTDAHIQELFAGATSIAHTPAIFCVPLRVRGALRRRVPDLLWTGPQGVRRPRRPTPVGARAGPPRLAEAQRSGRREWAGRPGRVPRDGDYAVRAIGDRRSAFGGGRSAGSRQLGPSNNEIGNRGPILLPISRIPVS